VSNWGGRRDGAGRKPRVPNKTGGEIREIARQFGPAVIQRLAQLADLIPGERADSHAVQIAAMKELLDRGYGRATTILAGDSEAPPAVIRFEWASAAPSAAADAAATAATAIDAEARPLSLIWENNC
jgi:hypothetical protein